MIDLISDPAFWAALFSVTLIQVALGADNLIIITVLANKLPLQKQTLAIKVGLVLAMGLRSMGIADDIVNLAFAFTLGAVAVAVALAFGLGGREAAGKQMEYILKKFRKED